MKRLRHSLRRGILPVAVALLLTGCATEGTRRGVLVCPQGRVGLGTKKSPSPISPTHSATNFNTRTLADPGLKRFLEENFKRRLEVWPMESWDFPTLIFAASYFHPNFDVEQTDKRAADAKNKRRKSASAEHLTGAGRFHTTAVAWQVQANVRTNLLHHVAARRRLELLNNLSEFQSEIIERGGNRQPHTGISWEKLSRIHTQFANTLIARLDTLEQVIQSREHLAEALGLPVRALLQVEVTYDFSRGARYEFNAADVQRLALQTRSDIAEVDQSIAAYQEAQVRLAARIAKLSTRKRERDAVAAQVKDGANAEIELLLLETRLAAARLAVFDAQVQFQHTLGSLEDATQQPVELWGVVQKNPKWFR